MRGGAALLVIQVAPAPPHSGLTFVCEQASDSGELAKRYSATVVLQALVQTLESTLAHYRQLLEERRNHGPIRQ